MLITTFTYANINDTLAEIILNKFENRYPCIDTDLPIVKSISTLPLDFKKYQLIKVEIRPSLLKKRKGTFKAIFKTNGKEKKIHFKFNIDAKIDVFKAKHKLYNDKILSIDDYEKVSIKLDKLPSKTITCTMPKKLMTKNYINVGSILTMNKFKYKKDVLRGANISAYLRDGMLVIETEATVLKDANVGEVVKIKMDNGKLFKAKLISKYKAIILE